MYIIHSHNFINIYEIFEGVSLLYEVLSKKSISNKKNSQIFFICRNPLKYFQILILIYP